MPEQTKDAREADREAARHLRSQYPEVYDGILGGWAARWTPEEIRAERFAPGLEALCEGMLRWLAEED